MTDARPSLGVLTGLALAAFVVALVVYLTGGATVDVWGARLSATRPERALFGSAVLFAVAIWVRGPAAVFGELRAVAGRLFRPVPMATGLVLFTFLAGVAWTSRAAGGSDSYGYLSEADLWSQGRLVVEEPFAAQVPWPEALKSFTPLGYWPATRPNAVAPIYAPGLPLLMAAAKAMVGHCAAFLIVPLSGGVLAAVTFGIGRRLGSDWIGVIGVWLLVTSPAFLVMLLNPMSDVPAAAFWALATYGLLGQRFVSLFFAGLAAGVAILVRPNLAPLAGLLAGWLIATRREHWRSAVTSTLLFAFGPFVASLMIAYLNYSLWGSPLKSGYGEIINWSSDYVALNLRNWFSWLITTQTPVVLAGWIGLYVPARILWTSATTRQTAALLGLLAAGVVLAYVMYLPFDSWWFLRFLLPAWPAMCLGTAALIWAVATRVGPLGNLVVVSGAIVLGAYTFTIARERGVLTSWQTDQRYAAVGALVERFTEPNSVIISGQHSGSLRYYAGRITLRYDMLAPDWLDQSVAWLAAHGSRAYLVLDEQERVEVRDRFGSANAIGRLDFPPVLSYQRGQTTYLYDPSNRAADTRVLGGDDVQTPVCAAPGKPASVTFEGRR